MAAGVHNDLDLTRKSLWSAPEAKPAAGEHDSLHVLEQYKLCVEMADRVSQRRGAANTFFLTLHTAIVGVLAGFYEEVDEAAIVAVFAAAIALCGVWALLLRSYRLLNRAKFDVIGLLEERLPASPLCRAEWQALGEGRDLRRYVALGPVETIVPAVFALIYLYLTVLTLT